GRRRSQLRPDAPLQPRCQGEGALCAESLRHRGAPAIRRLERAAGRRRVSRRRLFDRRHLHLSLGGPLRGAEHRSQRLPEREALGRGVLEGAGGAEGPGAAVNEAAGLLAGAGPQRVQAALAAAGSEARVVALTATARTAADAAASLGVPVGAIVKSLVFA